jgi:Protein of unknown function DUF262/Protein of unknown function (DUF1524)
LSISISIDSLVPEQETVSVRELILRQGWQFEIPFNQRPWVWNDSNLRDLWLDVMKTKDSFFEEETNGSLKTRPKALRNPHYFGAFLFFEQGSGRYEVVDGQQRLTSVSMLVAIFREIARGIATKENDLTLRVEAENLETSLTTWLLSSSNPPLPRLQLDQQFDEFFRSYVVDPRNTEDREEAFEGLSELVKRRKGALHLKNGFDTLRKHVVAGLDGLPDAQLVNWIGSLETVIADAFIGSRIVVRDEAFAFSVFGTLNARGVPLSAADKIKNELFERAHKDEHRQIKEDWDAIYEHVPEGNVELFLRLRHLAFVDTDCPRRHLFKNVRERELGDESPASVTARWRKDAELLACLTGLKSHPKIKGELERYLRSLHSQLKITYSWPLLLSSASRYLDGDVDTFRKLTRLTLAFCFRILTIGEADVSDLERPVAQAAFDLKEGEDPKEIAKSLRKANSDDDFEKDFASATLQRATTQFYTLYELEVHRAKNSGLSLEPFPHSPQQNIEHILPKRLAMSEGRQDEWAGWRYSDGDPIEDHSEYLNRLGNLLILEGEINGQVSNYDFEAKRTGNYPGQAANYKGAPRKSFVDSKLSLVKDLLDGAAYPDWTEAAIEKRQAEMAAEAVKTWTLKYVARGA